MLNTRKIFAIAAVVVGIATCFAGYCFSAWELKNSEGLVRGMLSQQVFDIDALNALLAEQGASVRVTGALDPLGNPKDDYVALAHELIDPSRETAFLLLSMLVLLAITVVQSCALFAMRRSQQSLAR